MAFSARPLGQEDGMTWSGVWPASNRRGLAAVAVVALLCGASGLRAQQAQGAAQNPAQGQQAQTPAPQPADPFVFASDESVLVFLTVTQDTAADFEATMAKVKEVLAKSDKPERKQQAAHWRVTKADVQQNGMFIYVMAIDPVVKGASYNPFKILGEGNLPPADLDALYKKVATGLKGISVMSLHNVVDMTNGTH
jgi:hypothetical protein